jgi:hypothetical protein
MSKTDKPDRPGILPAAAMENLKHEMFFGTNPAPAKGGRFGPGQSGNPKGRPKRAPEPNLSLGEQSVHAATLRESKRLVSIRENGKTSQVTMADAIVQAQLASAAKGHPIAQRDALARIERAQYEEARALAKSHEFWERYRDDGWAAIARAKRDGTPMPNPLPHPDDIVIEPGQRVRFEGPCNAEEAAQYAQTCELRDALVMQYALDERLDGDGPTTGALLALDVLNRILPERMRLSDAALTYQLLRYEGMAKRELLTRVYRAWRALGANLPRGRRFPPLERVKQRLEFGADLLAGFKSGALDVAAMSRGEFDDAALDLMEKHGVAAA